jgi:CHRD domain
MRSSGRAFWVLLPLFVAACGVDKSSPAPVGTTYGALAGPSISTDHATYAPGATVTVTFAGLPGNAKDWLAIAPAGSPNTTYIDFVFTNGQTGGTATFTAPAAGSYVARAFDNNTYTLLVESAVFTTAAGPTISTDQSTYAPGSTVTVTFAGLPGNAKDWLAIAAAGSDNTSYVAFVFTNGQTSGTATFTAPAPGSYVARAFENNTYTLIAQSAVFTTTAPSGTISTDQSIYLPGSTITVTYGGLPGNAKDWLAIAPAGSPNTTYTAFVFTNGQTSGTATFTAPASGTFVARAFVNNTYTLAAESAAFNICANMGGLLCFVASLDGTQENPVNASTATGSGRLISDTATNGIIYEVKHTVVNPTVGHIHQAPVGVNGPVIVPFTLVGQGASGTATLTGTQATALQAAGLYMNIHSGMFPGGEIRGVLLPSGS